MTERKVMAPGNPISPGLADLLRQLNGEPTVQDVRRDILERSYEDYGRSLSGPLDPRLNKLAERLHDREFAPSTVQNTNADSPQEPMPLSPWMQNPFGDPLRFIQALAEESRHRLDFTYCETDEHSLRVDGEFYHIGRMERKVQHGYEHNLNQLWIWPTHQHSRRKHNVGGWEVISAAIPQDIIDYVQRRPSKIPPFLFDRHNHAILGEFGYEIEYVIQYCEIRQRSLSKDGEEGERSLTLDIAQPAPGTFVLTDLHWDVPAYWKSFRSKFGDIQDQDFRSYLHRMFERYWQVPQARWNKPAVYTASFARHFDEVRPYFPQARACTAFDMAIHALLSDSERARLEPQLEDARFTIQRQFASIPRLNLGPTQLPCAGQKEALAADIVQGSYLLIQALALGMEGAEAEALVEQRLLHYILQQRGGQLNAERARSLLAMLRPSASEAP